MEPVIRAVIIVVMLLLVSSRRVKKTEGKNTPRNTKSPSQQTQNRKELDRRLSEGRARQKSDHSQVFGHSDDDDECVNEVRPAKSYSTTYVNDGRDPWDLKREKDPWEL
jgi:hypothetical protein